MPEHAHQRDDKHEAHRRLVERLRQQADDVRRLTAGLDEELIAKRTVPEKWSLKELVCHLHRVQQVFGGRVETMLVQDNPTTRKAIRSLRSSWPNPPRNRWPVFSKTGNALSGVSPNSPPRSGIVA